MSIIESISLFVIMAALAAIPGASVTLVVSRSATLGVANGLAVSAGIVLGDLMFIALALFGLSLVAEIMGNLFMVIKIAGGLYLIWTGFTLFAEKKPAKYTADKPNYKSSLIASFVAGFFLTLGDIKAIIFYASMLPVFIDLPNVKTPEILAVVFITIFSVGGVKVIYAVLAYKIAAFAHGINMGNAASKTAGGLMVGAGSYLIVKA